MCDGLITHISTFLCVYVFTVVPIIKLENDTFFYYLLIPSMPSQPGLP